MAMIACRECSGAVSAAAPFCPHCGIGRPDRVQAQRGMTADVARAVLLVVVLGAVLVLVLSALGI